MPEKKRPKRKTPAPAPETSQHGPDLPYWLPSGEYWDGLPSEIREAVPRVLAPAYKKFVIDAPGELERSLGLTLVHLVWLEVCDHVRMALAAADPLSLAATLNDPDTMIARHLNLITAKCQAAELLVKLRLVSDVLNAPPAPAGSLVEPNLLPSPSGGHHGVVGAGGEDQSLPSPFGRGAGGEGRDVPLLTNTAFPFPIETAEEIQ